jgi:hypothetical protein
MPYIREQYKEILENDTPKNPGELNYKITKTCIEYLHNEGTSYKTINEIIGVLECAKMEFYRRIAVPYENLKKKENGDVY